MNPNYNLVTPFYDFLAWLVHGKAIRKAQVEFLHHIPKNAKILIVGGGTGWIIDEVMKYSTDITFVDISSKMIQKAKNGREGVKFICDDILSVEEEGYDVIITPFFFDQFEKSTLDKMIPFVLKKLNNGGLLLYTDFTNNSNPRMLKLMYWFFRMTCRIEAKQLVDCSPYFEELELLKEKRFKKRFVVSRVYQLPSLRTKRRVSK